MRRVSPSVSGRQTKVKVTKSPATSYLIARANKVSSSQLGGQVGRPSWKPGVDFDLAVNLMSLVFDERSVLQILHCLAQFVLGIHHNRTLPGHRLLDRLPGYEQESDAV